MTPAPDLTNIKEEIKRQISAGRLERHPEAARRFFSEGARLSKQWFDVSSQSEAKRLRSQSLAELALLESSRSARAAYWKSALQCFSSPWDELSADSFALTAIDFAQDRLLATLEIDRLQILRTARKALDEVLENTPNERRGRLLARRASVLRHLLIFEPTKAAKLDTASTALRCVQAAIQRCEDHDIRMELAECEWSVARHSKTDEAYGVHLRNAIEHLSSPELERVPIARLSLSSVYRSTFRPLQACTAYPEALSDLNLRRLLRQSFVQAEAAIQLWFRKYPPDIVNRELQRATSLLEEAIAAGYSNARLVSDLAFVRAALGDVSAAMSVLDGLVTKSGLDWTEIAAEINRNAVSDPVMECFLIGIAQSPVLTRLGTFIWQFSENAVLVEALYRAAVNVGRTDAIALTNLARFLIETGGSHSEARRLLDRAASAADTRFKWWRQVRAMLPMVPSSRSLPRKQVVDPRSFDALRKEFQRIKSEHDMQGRGHLLESLVERLATLTVGKALPPYRFPRVGGDRSEVDGFFPHRFDRYRIECKWETNQTVRKDIVVFHDKIHAANVSGLFISMAGFADSAIAAAREYVPSRPILLMDGEEIEALFENWLNFDVVLAEKRLQFDAKSNPYYRVASDTSW